MRDELGQSFAFLPGRSEAWIWIAKPVKSSIKKFIRGRSVPSGTLSVKGPTKNSLCRTIMVCSHPSQPMVDQCRLADASPSNDYNDVIVFFSQCTLKESNIPLPTKNIASCNR